MLRQGKKADFQAYLKNSNYKMAFSTKGAHSKTLDNSGIKKQVSSIGNPYESGQNNSCADKDSKVHLTKMSATIAQNSQENSRHVGVILHEKPHYATTKDIHFPITNFESTIARVTNDAPQE